MKDLSRMIPVLFVALSVLFLSACGKTQQQDESATSAQAPEAITLPDGLPQLTACQVLSKPLLPAKWTASALMQTFGEHDVVLGTFVYDDAEKAYRFSLSRPGSSSYTDYLLTADNRLYALQGPYEEPTSCSYSLHLQMELPSRDILSSEAACIGEAPVNGVNRQWWRDNAEAKPGANWYWFDADEQRSLFRTMPYKGVDNLGISGKYAFSYYSDFSAQDSTNIGALKELCGVDRNADSLPAGNPQELATALEQLMPPADEGADAENDSAAFFAGVEQCASPDQLPPQWPQTIQTTTLLTAVNVKYSPFPSLVRYDAAYPGLRTDMYNPWPKDPGAWDLYSARLAQDTGYSAFFAGEQYQSCKQDLPGPPVASWMSVDGCECKASLPAGTVLNPRDEDLLVVMCPLTPSTNSPDSIPQVFWTWYGEESGSPQVFMQSDSSAKDGTGLNLADYYSWNPNVSIDPEIFIPPAECLKKEKTSVPPQCHNCHLPTNSEFMSDEAALWHIPLP